MQKVNIKDIPEESWGSPSGKFAAAAGYSTGTGFVSGNGILAIVPLGK